MDGCARVYPLMQLFLNTIMTNLRSRLKDFWIEILCSKMKSCYTEVFFEGFALLTKNWYFKEKPKHELKAYLHKMAYSVCASLCFCMHFTWRPSSTEWSFFIESTLLYPIAALPGVEHEIHQKIHFKMKAKLNPPWSFTSVFKPSYFALLFNFWPKKELLVMS